MNVAGAWRSAMSAALLRSSLERLKFGLVVCDELLLEAEQVPMVLVEGELFGGNSSDVPLFREFYSSK